MGSMRRKNLSFLKVIWTLIKVSSYRRILFLAVGCIACLVSGILVPIRGLIAAFFYVDFEVYLKDGKSDRESSKILGWAYLYYYLGVVAILTSFVQIILWELANDELINYLKNGFFAQALRMDVSWHDSLAKEEDLSTTLSEDVENIKGTLGSKMSYAIATICSLIGAFLCCLYMDVYFFLIVITGGLVVTSFTLMFGRIAATMAGKEQLCFREVGSVAGEVLTSLRTVKAYNAELEELSRFSTIVHSVKRLAMRKNIVLAGLASISSSFVFLIFASVAAVAGYLVYYGVIPPGYLLGTVFAAMLGIFAFVCTFSMIGDISNALSSCSNLLGLLDLNPLIDPYSNEGTRVSDLEGDIIFKDVSFSYPTRKNIEVLKKINLTIPSGKTVALVGPSGSGKSSVLSLILRFFDPDAGQIYIGKNHVQNINLFDLRKKIGVVSQEPVLFDGTVEDNIRYGNLEANHDEIQFAARQANAHDFIMKLPDGYKTLVGERGTMLSGGQKQRIAIARALIRLPNILLLDEATSALDSHSEKVVQETLENVSSRRTTIIVAHRLSSIRNADLIFVMKDGIVVEKGTHDELMKTQGTYFTLHSQQSAHEVPHKSEISEDLDFLPLPKDAERRFSFNRLTYDRRPSALSAVSSVKGYQDDRSLPKKSVTKNDGSPHLVSQLLKMSNKWYLSLAILSSIALGFHMPVFVYVYFYRLLMTVTTTVFTLSSVYEIGVEAIFFALAVAIVSFVMYFSASLATENVIERLRVDMFRALLNRKMTFFDDAETSPTRMVNVIIQNPGQLGNVFGAKAGSSIACIVFVVTATTISMVVSLKMALIHIGFVIITGVSNYLQVAFKYRIQASRENQEKIASKLASICFDNIKVVHYLSLQNFMIESYKQSSTLPRREKWKQILILGFFYSIITNISFFYAGVNMQFGFIWEGYSHTSMNLYFMCSFMVQNTFNAITSMVLHLQDAGKSKPAVEESIKLVGLSDFDETDSGDCSVSRGGIEFKNVRFAYPEKIDHPILKGFSLEIQPGQTVALVGPSGNGKSTILSLLERFYEASSGTISIDGVDIRSIKVSHLRNSMALVTQEPLLFNTTIRENILYGVQALNASVTEDDLIECCKQANIYDFINTLPERFETHVGARGSRLSGGQKQRIAVARALVRNPKILLLDEATSALDTESEKEVQKALNMASKGRTTIMVAHRLTTVANADVIVVVDEGVVKEKGSHKVLMNLKGKYYEMLRESNE